MREDEKIIIVAAILAFLMAFTSLYFRDVEPKEKDLIELGCEDTTCCEYIIP